MKNLFLAALPLLFYALTFQSCTQDLVPEPEPQTESVQEVPSPTTSNSCEQLLGSIVQENGMLVFQDYAEFIQVQECLLSLKEAQNDAFVAQFPNYTPAELDSVADTTDYHENGALVEFENKLNFVSLRSEVDGDVERWLDEAGVDPDWETFPRDEYVVSDEFLTLLNLNGQAKIGGTVTDFKNGQTSVVNQNFVSSREGFCFWADCCYVGFTSRVFRPSSTQAIRMTIGLTAQLAFLHSQMMCGVDNYTRRRGRWRRTRALMNTSFRGRPRAFSGCQPASQDWGGTSQTLVRRSIGIVRHHWGWIVYGQDGDFSTAANVNQFSGVMPLIF